MEKMPRYLSVQNLGMQIGHDRAGRITGCMVDTKGCRRWAPSYLVRPSARKPV